MDHALCLGLYTTCSRAVSRHAGALPRLALKKKKKYCVLAVLYCLLSFSRVVLRLLSFSRAVLFIEF